MRRYIIKIRKPIRIRGWAIDVEFWPRNDNLDGNFASYKVLGVHPPHTLNYRRLKKTTFEDLDFYAAAELTFWLSGLFRVPARRIDFAGVYEGPPQYLNP